MINVKKLEIDKIIETANGGVKMYLYAEELDNSIDTQVVLMDKVEMYLDYIKSEEFQKKHINADADNTYIILVTKTELTSLWEELCHRIGEWTQYHNAIFNWQLKENISD